MMKPFFEGIFIGLATALITWAIVVSVQHEPVPTHDIYIELEENDETGMTCMVMRSHSDPKFYRRVQNSLGEVMCRRTGTSSSS